MPDRNGWTAILIGTVIGAIISAAMTLVLGQFTIISSINDRIAKNEGIDNVQDVEIGHIRDNVKQMTDINIEAMKTNRELVSEIKAERELLEKYAVRGD